MFKRSTQRGFTLIEVLVALAVVSICLTAVFQQSSRSASSSARLQDKTLAHWIAMNQLTLYEVGDAWPDVGNEEGTVQMADREWIWTATISATPQKAIRRVDMTVSLESNKDKSLTLLTGFLSEP